MHVGQGTALELHEVKLGRWLCAFQEPSYLDIIPSLYNESSLLQCVVKCTMAQYKKAMYAESEVSENRICQLYGKALAELQAALNDGKRRDQPDVLIATAVLQLFEVGYIVPHKVNIY